MLSLLLIGGAVYFAYTEDFYGSYLTEGAEIFQSLDAYIEENPADFQKLLSNPAGGYDFELGLATEKDTKTADKILKENQDAVVLIYDYYYFGTGFLLSSNGLIATNYHVVQDSVDIAVATTDSNIHPVESVIAYDIDKDFALIKIPGENFPHVTVGDSDLVTVGEDIVVIGNPEGLSNTISNGIISGVRDYDLIGQQIQITAPISGGSSGGPIFNTSGQVIGVAQSSIVSNEAQNLNFGVPINYVLDSFDHTVPETE